MTSRTPRWQQRARESRDAAAAVLRQVEAGELEATPARVWHLRGVVDGLSALLGEDGGPSGLAFDVEDEARRT